MSYLEILGGYQTYLFTPNCEPIKYKFFSTKEELDKAIQACYKAGWKVSNATPVVNFFMRLSRR
ncbi:hypothetical protein [Gloeothece verrucosa]|nr:hypothetical protein [Gloeothece verrucosa]